MRLALCLAILTAVGGLGLAHPARGQSLGEVSRKEEERRKDVKSPAKVYTNKDLGSPLTSVSPDSPKSTAPATPQASKDASKAGDDKSKDSPAKDQPYWAKRKKELQDRLERSKTQLDGMQTRINALTADFASHDDPVQRASIERDRQRALGELARLQQDIKDTQKALADLDEEARKAGIPPGWLR